MKHKHKIGNTEIRKHQCINLTIVFKGATKIPICSLPICNNLPYFGYGVVPGRQKSVFSEFFTNNSNSPSLPLQSL
jgi:hypothetical protein